MTRSHPMPLAMLTMTLLVCEHRPASAAEPAAARQIDPEAVELIESANKLVSNADSFAVRVQMDFTVSAVLPGTSGSRRADLTFQRPNQWLVRRLDEKDGEAAKLVSDGRQVLLHFVERGEYALRDAPADGWELVGYVDEIAQTADLLEDFGKALLKDAQAVSVTGQDNVKGVLCHRLRVRSDDVRDNDPPMDVELWIEAGDKPFLRGIKPDTAAFIRDASESQPLLKLLNIKMAHRFDDWRLDEKVPAERFAISIPEGAKRIEWPSLPELKSRLKPLKASAAASRGSGDGAREPVKTSPTAEVGVEVRPAKAGSGKEPNSP